MKKSVSELMGALVNTPRGDVVGMVDDVIINAHTGNLEYLSVQPMGTGRNMRVRLTWNEVSMDPLQDGLTLAPGESVVKRLLMKAAAEA